jgi:UDP-N-acetylmuramate--alanine ligase
MSSHQAAAAARPWQGRRLHLIGVGGAGMSGYARAAHALGAIVGGSDAADSDGLRRLQDDGVLSVAHVGHSAVNLPPAQDEPFELYYSSAITETNPERVAARERGIEEHPRAELLAQLSAMRRTIAVAGTHGKTTTCSMLVEALSGANLDPGWLIGAPASGERPNAHWSEGEWLVVEADESDGSMLSLDVEIAVLTNVELDHHARFASLAELREDFRRFLTGAPEAVIWDRPELLALRPGDGTTAYATPDASLRDGGSRFTWRGHEVRLSVPGIHNATNATAALEAARLAGAEEARAVAALADFSGAGRRFQLLGHGPGGAAIYEDYAHHPTEIAATLAGARTLPHRRLVAVFQPHLFSRTQLLAPEFGRALAQADAVLVLDVYPARERAEDHPGVSGLTIAERTADAAGGKPVYWLPRFADATHVLDAILRADDVCVVMGAGDVDRLAHGLADGP